MDNKFKEFNVKDLQNDLDRSVIDSDAEDFIQRLSTRFKIDNSVAVKKYNNKKKKNLESKITKERKNSWGTNEDFWLDKNEIDTARQAFKLNPIVLKVRNCLGCSTRFESEGTHNRLCDDCRKDQGF